MRLLVTVFCIFFATKSFSQIGIQGPPVVQRGSYETYEAVGAPSGALIQWFVSGGTIQTSGPNGCIVHWNEEYGIGEISVSEDINGGMATLQVMIGGPFVSPQNQILSFGENPQQFCVTLVGQGTFQWQILTAPNTWSNIQSANQQCYLPPMPTMGNPATYRCVVVINSVTYYTNEASVEKRVLDPGSLTLAQPVAYNSAPVINQGPATGGECAPVSYQYTWEQSVESGPWVPVGNTVLYPSNAPIIIGNTLVRRKIICGSETKYTNVISISPTYTSVDAENRNYIRTYTVFTRDIQSWFQADQLESGKKLQETTYFDGLGRTIQFVSKETSTASNNTLQDLVSFLQYDNLGRSTQQYLPYPTGGDPGKFKTSTNDQTTFYTANYNETNPWGRTDLENSPLNRIMKEVSPGSHRLTNNIGTSFIYDFNDGNNISEKVHVWRIGYVPGALPAGSALDIYQAGSLLKTVITDERGKKVVEYKDRVGNSILKKVQLKESGAGLTDEHDGWLCTYYVYDDFNRLRFVITPKAVAYLDTHNWTINQAIADELCFYYEYDGKGRLIVKKTPGVSKLNMVYDQRDRVVFEQDGNQAARAQREWLVHFYDDLNRPVSTGIYKTQKSRDQLQADIDLAAISTSFTIPRGAAIVDLEISTRPAINPPSRYAATNSIEFLAEFTSNENDDFVAEIDPFASESAQAIPVVVNATLPVNTNDPSIFTALTYQYYDNYSFTGAKSFDNNYNNLEAYPSTSPDVEAIVLSKRTTGMPTGSKVRVLGTETFLLSTIYYDENGRILQALGENHKGGTDIETNQYHFDGRILSRYTKHSANNSIFNGFGILTKNSYDRLGHLTTLQKKYGNAGFKTIAAYAYDEFGRLKSRKIGQKPNAVNAPLETLQYTYNAMGLLTGINKDYALSANNADQWNNFFGLHLGYENFENRFANARFDKLVTGLIWKTQGDNTPRKYDFGYDNAGRFISADFNQKSKPSETTWANAKMDFSESNILYDENGNIRQLYRKGVIPGNNSALYIDKLSYTYKQSNGGEWTNQLLKVFDDNPGLGASNNGKLGDFKDEVYNSNTDDYTYDANGNLVTDNNKKIRDGANQGITYNYLNKPEKIILENKSTVEFTYDAAGTKLAKKVTPAGGTARTTYYIGEFIYQENDLQFILHEEGRVRIMMPVSSTSPMGASAMTINGNVQLVSGKWGVFDYFIKDHLESVRMVITEEEHKEFFTASMETAAATEEEPLFGKVDNNGNPLHPGNELYDTRFAKPSTWSSNSSAWVSKLFTTGASNTRSIGPNVLLKVMSGDYLHATTKYYYDVPSAPFSDRNVLSTLVNSIFGGLSGSSINPIIKDGATSIQNTLQDPNASPLLPFLNNRPAPGTNRPKAYLNYVFFDENFNFVEEGSGAKPVDGQQNDYNITQPNIRVPRNGYVFVYLSNESDWPVYFDDFKVTHERGAIIEESHCYPHGLKIAGISSRAFNKLDNKYGFQGSYSEEEEESGYDEFELRMYDAQIGRWIQPDPYDEFASPYLGMGNDPVNFSDPSGGRIFDFGVLGNITGSVLGDRLLAAGAGALAGFGIDKLTGGSGVWGAAIGAGVGFGVTFIPPIDFGGIGGALKDVAPVLAIQGASIYVRYASYSSDDEWKPFYKSDLITYTQLKGINPTENNLGEQFENIFEEYMTTNHPVQAKAMNFRRADRVWTEGTGRNSKPDFVSDDFYDQRGHCWVCPKKEKLVSEGSGYEIKQNNGRGIYLSSNNDQIKGHIDNLAVKHAKDVATGNYNPSLTLITTYDVNWSPSITRYAGMQGVQYTHRRAMYKIVNRKYQFKFVGFGFSRL